MGLYHLSSAVPFAVLFRPSKFVLLLVLFVRPILAPQANTQSGGAIYRIVAIRSLICTICVVLSYVITTVVFILAIRRESSENDEVRRVRGE